LIERHLQAANLIDGQDDDGHIRHNCHHRRTVPDFADVQAMTAEFFIPRLRDGARGSMSAPRKYFGNAATHSHCHIVQQTEAKL
jgi:hypothetical protein